MECIVGIVVVYCSLVNKVRVNNQVAVQFLAVVRMQIISYNIPYQSRAYNRLEQARKVIDIFQCELAIFFPYKQQFAFLIGFYLDKACSDWTDNFISQIGIIKRQSTITLFTYYLEFEYFPLHWIFCVKGRLVITTELDVGKRKKPQPCRVMAQITGLRFVFIFYFSRNSSRVHGNGLISVSFRLHGRLACRFRPTCSYCFRVPHQRYAQTRPAIREK